MAKMSFTQKNLAELTRRMNMEHKGFNACVKTINLFWKELSDIGKVDGLRKEHLNSAWIIERLNGGNFCQDGVLGQTVKGEFKPRATWTPKIVVAYLQRATAVEWRAIQKSVKESQKQASK